MALQAGDSSWTPSETRAVSLVTRAGADPALTGVAAGLQRVCRAAVQGLPVWGAAVHLADRSNEMAVAVASDPRAREIGDLAFTTGVAPSIEALGCQRPVLVPDLDGSRDWPGFTSPALDQGVRAVYALPLHLGAISLGVLELYADTVGPLSEEDLAVALALAQVAAAMTLARGAEGEPADFAVELDMVVDRRPEVHQAQGMVMVALGVPLVEALMRMRARAFEQGTSVADLARGVIAGSTRPEDWDDK